MSRKRKKSKYPIVAFLSLETYQHIELLANRSKRTMEDVLSEYSEFIVPVRKTLRVLPHLNADSKYASPLTVANQLIEVIIDQAECIEARTGNPVTLHLNDDVHARLEKVAAESDTTIADLITNTLQDLQGDSFTRGK